MISDGECAEGSIWEALRVAYNEKLTNLRVVVLCNGYSALSKVDVDLLDQRLHTFMPVENCLIIKANLFNYPDFLQGLEGHYHVMTDEDYAELKLEEVPVGSGNTHASK
jgi:hypothetical protein